MHNTTHTSLVRRSRQRLSQWLATTGRVLKLLPLVLALGCAPGLRAQINPLVAGLPQGGTVTAASGTVAGSLSGDQKTLTLTQTGNNRAVIDWQSFNIDSGRTVQFVQPSASAAVLNRVPASAGLSEISGTMTANGLVLLMNPNGVLFKSGASINVGSLIATTGTVNQTDFLAGGTFGITGVSSGSVSNQGAITAASAGLVALVAPSLSNQGSIVATGGRIALSGADRATVTLNGGLYEFAVPSGALGTNATVSNTTAARLDGANLLLSTGDAANLVSGVINLQGVQRASGAMVVNGNTVVLTSDLDAPAISGSSNAIQVQAGASIQDAVKIAKTGTPGAGATVEVQAGSYAEQLTLNKANLTLSGQAGAKLVVSDLAVVNGIALSANNVTVQGLEIAGPINAPYYDYYATPKSNISRGIAVGDGITGFAIRNNNIHDVRNGILIHGRNSTGTVSNNTIENTKSGISVQYTDASGITISSNREGPIGNEWGVNLHLNGHLDGTGNILSNTPPIATAPSTAWQQSLLNLSTANNGWGVQDQGYTAANRTQAMVATSGAASNQGSRLTPIDTVQSGINAVVPGGTVTVAAGTYTQASTLNISKTLTLAGAGEATTIIDAHGLSSGYGLSVSADDVTLRDFTFYGPSAFYASAYGIKVSPGGSADARLRNFTINRVTSRGAGKAELDLNGVDGALIDQVTLNGAPVGNDAGSTQGAGLQLTDSASVTVSNTTTLNNAWGGLAIYQANRSYNQQVNNIRIEGSNRFHETNPVYLQDESALYDFGRLEIAGFGYAVRNADSDASRQYTWLQATPQQAYDYAVNLPGATASYIQGWDGSATTQNFQVGVGYLSGGGTQAMSIAAAVNQAGSGANVNVGAGTYAENVRITKALTLKGAGAGQSIVDPASGNAVQVSGNMGASAAVLIDGFSFRNAPTAGVSVESGTVLGQLTIQNSDFSGNGAYGFTANGSSTAGIPGLASVSLLNSSFEGNGAPSTSATSLGQGDIHFNYYNGNATLRNLTITGNTEHTGIHFRGYHDAGSGAVFDAGTWVFDNVTLAGSFLRPGGSAGTWNPSGPGDAMHIFEYGSMANVSFNGVKLNPTVGHGMFLEGLSSTVNVGNTAFGVPDGTLTGEGSNPTLSMNIVAGSNSQNNVKTNVDATHATFTGATSGFDIEDRVGHALDVTGTGLVTWSAGNVYVTPVSGSVQRGVDAAAAGNTVNVAAGIFTQPSKLSVNKSLTLAGAGQALTTIDARSVSNDAGMSVSADNVTLRDFTFYGPMADANASVGISVAPTGGSTARLLNFSMSDATSRGAGRAELEFNGVNGALINGVTLDGAPVAGGADTLGSGLHVLDSANVTVRNSSTANNADGGVAIHQANLSYDQQVSGIRIEGNNVFGELNPVSLRNESATQNIGSVSTAGLDYAVGNAGTTQSAQYTWLQATQQKAFDFAVNLPNAGSSDVRGWTGSATTQNFSVGVGNLTAGGAQAMSVGAAVDHAVSGANVDVSTGTYPEYVTVNSRYNLRFNDATVHGLTLNAGASDSGISGKLTADTAAGLVFNAPVSLRGDTTLATNGADIALNGHVQNADAGQYALSVLAGSGTNRGDVSMTTGGSQSSPLGLLTITSKRYTLASTLWVQGYNIDALGDVALSNHTLNAMDAGSSNTLTSAGDVTGTTTSKGSVAFVSAGNVQANVSADGATSVTATNISGSIASKSGVDLAGSGDVSATVTSDGAAKVTATNISGSIASKGDVDLTGTGNVSATVTTDGAAKVTATNISGSIASKGNADLAGTGDVSATVAAGGGATVSARNISGAIAGRDVSVSAQEKVDVAVTASNSATLTGDSVQGSVSAQSVTVQAGTQAQVALDTATASVHSEGSVNLSGNAAQVSIDAPHGSVSGNFGQVSNAGSGLFSVNGRPELNPVLRSTAENSRVNPVHPTSSEAMAPATVLASGQARPAALVLGSEMRIERSSPMAAGAALEQGLSVEIDLTPGQDRERP